MKIIIIGEYSGFSKSLNKGLRQLGHDSFVFSWGDVFKKIEPDERTYLINVSNYHLFNKVIRGSARIRRIFSALKLHSFVKNTFKNEKADIVLVINMAFLKESNNIFIPRFSDKLLLYMTTESHNIYMSSCGNDYIVNSYLPFNKRTNEYLMFKYLQNNNEQKRKFEHHIRNIKGIFPIAYDYALAYLYNQKQYGYFVFPTIPLPFDVNSVKSHNVISERIVIMHGVSRPFEKGSYIILSALEKIKIDFPDKVDVQVVRNLPLKDYLKVMKDSNIIVDQCYGCSNGMNTIEALSMGKVVLSGNLKEYHCVYTNQDNPVVNIEPNSDQIYNALAMLINNPDRIKEISIASRRFAEENHDCVNVARKYIELFGKGKDSSISIKS